MEETTNQDLPDAKTTAEVEPDLVASWVSTAADQRPLLIDCREQEELDICRIEECEWIPLREIPQRIEAIREASERGVVVYCHHGVRSLHATHFLRNQGITRAFSLRGGIGLWSTAIDKNIPRY